MQNITKEEFYRAAEDKSQLEAFVEKIIDNMPLVIDLKNVNIELDENAVSIDYEPWLDVYCTTKKLVCICNYRIDGNPMPPTLLDNSSVLDDVCRAIVKNNGASPIAIGVDLSQIDDHKVTINATT